MATFKLCLSFSRCNSALAVPYNSFLLVNAPCFLSGTSCRSADGMTGMTVMSLLRIITLVLVHVHCCKSRSANNTLWGLGGYTNSGEVAFVFGILASVYRPEECLKFGANVGILVQKALHHVVPVLHHLRLGSST